MRCCPVYIAIWASLIGRRQHAPRLIGTSPRYENSFPIRHITLMAPYGHHSSRSGLHASLQHTVFLGRKSCNNISSYDFGVHDFNADGTCARWSININEETLRQLFDSDDEAFLSISLPSVLHRHCTSVGGAVAVHFAYSSQR